MPTILTYDFMVRAFEAGLVLALVAPTIGIFFVVRRASAMADTLAHVSLAGIAGGLFLGLSSVASALLACALAAVGIERIRERRTLTADTLTSLFLFGGLALGVVLIGLRPAGGVNIASVLFGNILTVTDASLRGIAIIGALALITAAILWRPLLAVALDEDVAAAGGMPVRALHYVLAILGAATIAIAINIVGVLLIGALMVIPVLAAMQFRLGFQHTWAIATAIAILSVLIGLTASYSLDLASGATIVLVAVCCFILASLIAPLSHASAAAPTPRAAPQ